MKAVVYNQYGPPAVLQLKEVPMPTPGDREVRIKIRATAANSGDSRLRKADPFGVRLFFGLLKPNRNILGGVFSGEIESVGKDVTLYKVGDEVFGATGMSFGAYGEYKCLPEDGIFSIKPGKLTHTEAAVIPFGGTTALHFLKKANIQKGQKVLILGASGAVGTAAVQLAAYLGAEVTGVCSPSSMELVKSLGAKKVIDYTREDFTKKRRNVRCCLRYDRQGTLQEEPGVAWQDRDFDAGRLRYGRNDPGTLDVAHQQTKSHNRNNQSESGRCQFSQGGDRGWSIEAGYRPDLQTCRNGCGAYLCRCRPQEGKRGN